MKKFALALLATSAIAAGANAADPRADMVFEGAVTSVVPGDSLTITGVGGGSLQKGSLTVNTAGQVSTIAAVDFEVHKVLTDGSVGELVPTFQGQVYGTALQAGNFIPDNSLGDVRINNTDLLGTVANRNFEVRNKDRSTVEYTYAKNSETGLDLGVVGTGTAIIATVRVIISELDGEGEGA